MNKDKSHSGEDPRARFKTREYICWLNMRTRCNNPKYQDYHRYGGRGIRVCKRWDNYDLFRKDMGKCKDGFTIDRIDNDKGYNKSNCKWTTRKEQMNNTSINKKVKFNGITMNLSQWAEKYKINYSLLQRRLSDGWDIETALTKPSKGWRKIRLTYKGSTKPIGQWAIEKGLNIKALDMRIRNGWTASRALNTPIQFQRAH